MQSPAATSPRLLPDDPARIGQVRVQTTINHVPQIPVMPTNAKPRQKPKSRKAAAKPAALGFRLTNPDRIVYPEIGLTKHDVANYYVSVAKWMLPQIIGRPLSLVRCPEGLRGQCFFQKHPPVGLPAVVERIQIQEKSELRTYSVIQNLEGLIALVQFGTLEFHAWGSRAADLERPDRLVFDLDPDPSVAWKDVVNAARTLRQLLSKPAAQELSENNRREGIAFGRANRPKTYLGGSKSICSPNRRQHGGGGAGQIYRHHVEGRTARKNLYRLFAQRTGRHLGCRLFNPGKTIRHGLDAHRLGRTGQASRAGAIHLAKCPRAIGEAAQRSLETDLKSASNIFLTKQLDCFAKIPCIHASHCSHCWLNRGHSGARRPTFGTAHGPDFPQNSQNRAAAQRLQTRFRTEWAASHTQKGVMS